MTDDEPTKRKTWTDGDDCGGCFWGDDNCSRCGGSGWVYTTYTACDSCGGPVALAEGAQPRWMDGYEAVVVECDDCLREWEDRTDSDWDGSPL